MKFTLSCQDEIHKLSWQESKIGECNTTDSLREIKLNLIFFRHKKWPDEPTPIISAIANESGTEQRGEHGIRVTRRKRKTKPFIRDDIFGESAIGRVTRKKCFFAEVLPA
jgi:hypothetical protein